MWETGQTYQLVLLQDILVARYGRHQSPHLANLFDHIGHLGSQIRDALRCGEAADSVGDVAHDLTQGGGDGGRLRGELLQDLDRQA